MKKCFRVLLFILMVFSVLLFQKNLVYASEEPVWEKVFITDAFGDQTGEYCLTNGKHFSGSYNSASVNKGELNADLVIQYNNGIIDAYIILYVDGTEQIKNGNLFDINYNITIKKTDGDKINIYGILESNSDRIQMNPSADLIEAFCSGEGEVGIYIEEDERKLNNYLFEASCDNFGELYEQEIHIPYMEYYYQQAETLLQEKKYDEAAAAFKALKDYKDSTLRAEKIHEAQKEEIYQQAESLLRESKYDEAAETFESLGEYKDSASRAEDIYGSHITKKDMVMISVRGDSMITEGESGEGYPEKLQKLIDDNDMFAEVKDYAWYMAGTLSQMRLAGVTEEEVDAYIQKHYDMAANAGVDVPLYEGVVRDDVDEKMTDRDDLDAIPVICMGYFGGWYYDPYELVEQQQKILNTYNQREKFLILGLYPEMAIDTGYYDTVLSEAWGAHYVSLGKTLTGTAISDKGREQIAQMVYDKLIELGYISKKPQESAKENYVAVPDLYGYSENDAKMSLDMLGLTYETVSGVSDSYSNGQVITISPDSGTMVPPGSMITLTINDYVEPTSEPTPVPAIESDFVCYSPLSQPEAYSGGQVELVLVQDGNSITFYSGPDPWGETGIYSTPIASDSGSTAEIEVYEDGILIARYPNVAFEKVG